MTTIHLDGGITLKGDAEGLQRLAELAVEVGDSLRRDAEKERAEACVMGLVKTALSWRPSENYPRPPIRARVALEAWDRRMWVDVTHGNGVLDRGLLVEEVMEKIRRIEARHHRGRVQ